MKAILNETGITIKPENVAEQLALRHLFPCGDDISQKVLIDNNLEAHGIAAGLAGDGSDLVRFPFSPSSLSSGKADS